MKALIILIGILFFVNNFAHSKCTFSIKPTTEKLTWTGYKFTNKKAVPGTFDDIRFIQKESDSIEALLKTIEFNINTNSLNSGNPARDATLKATVFNLLKVPNDITGKISFVRNDLARAQMMFNEPTIVNFKTNYDEKKQVLTAKGSIDLLKQGLKPNYDAVHEQCEKLHTGDDGVSRTWSTVDLTITAEIFENCSLLDKVKKLFN